MSVCSLEPEKAAIEAFFKRYPYGQPILDVRKETAPHITAELASHSAFPLGWFSDCILFYQLHYFDCPVPFVGHFNILMANYLEESLVDEEIERGFEPNIPLVFTGQTKWVEDSGKFGVS